MPYKSNAQRAYLHAENPDLAAKWDAEIRAKKPHKSSVKAQARKAFGGRTH